jgi:hypothetical protein
VQNSICLHCETFFCNCFASFSYRLRWRWNWTFLCVCCIDFSKKKFSIKPTIGYEKASTVFYIFLIFNFFTVFESSFALLSNAVFLFLDSLKCVIIFTFLSFSVCFYCFKKNLTHYFFLLLIKQHEIYSSLNFISTIFWLIHFTLLLDGWLVYGGTVRQSAFLIAFSPVCWLFCKNCSRLELRKSSHRNLCWVVQGVVTWEEFL